MSEPRNPSVERSELYKVSPIDGFLRLSNCERFGRVVSKQKQLTNRALPGGYLIKGGKTEIKWTPENSRIRPFLTTRKKGKVQKNEQGKVKTRRSPVNLLAGAKVKEKKAAAIKAVFSALKLSTQF